MKGEGSPGQSCRRTSREQVQAVELWVMLGVCLLKVLGLVAV
jgi:hypothetical protein